MAELKPNISHLKCKWLNFLLKENDFHFMLNHKAKLTCSLHTRSKSKSNKSIVCIKEVNLIQRDIKSVNLKTKAKFIRQNYIAK